MYNVFKTRTWINEFTLIVCYTALQTRLPYICMQQLYNDFIVIIFLSSSCFHLTESQQGSGASESAAEPCCVFSFTTTLWQRKTSNTGYNDCWALQEQGT